MSANSRPSIQISINYPLFFGMVLLVHIILMFLQNPDFSVFQYQGPSIKQFKVHRIADSITPEMPKIRTAGKKDGQKNSFAPAEKARKGTIATPMEKLQPKNLSLSDLAQAQPKAVNVKPQVRAGTRPEVLPAKPKGLSAISLKGKQIQEFTSGASAAALSGDPRANSLQNSDVLVNLEVPEGVDIDELNKYEMMFYGFQRRTAINYINSFYKKLDKFNRENPHLRFPMTDSKQVMTGRMTFDKEGNVKQIKMIRWTHNERLQNFFEDVLKEMDTLHNPPHALWDKTGEFSIFFSLVVNG